MTRLLALVLLLAACDGDAIDETPDATPFCNPFREECGTCGVEGADCCINSHERAEDTRPTFYCIDGSMCVGGNTPVCDDIGTDEEVKS